MAEKLREYSKFLTSIKVKKNKKNYQKSGVFFNLFAKNLNLLQNKCQNCVYFLIIYWLDGNNML